MVIMEIMERNRMWLRCAIVPALMGAIVWGSVGSAVAVEDSGVRRITLRILNAECKAMSPQGDLNLNPNPSDLNDGNLDDAEIVALESGCKMRAYVTDKFGRRVKNAPVVLLRAPATGGAFVVFGRSRTTNARGLAVWGFDLGPDTNFVYRVGIPSREVLSNRVNIELCTGRDTANIFPSDPTELGEGCDVPGEGD
jgi:hypothetical protein